MKLLLASLLVVLSGCAVTVQDSDYLRSGTRPWARSDLAAYSLERMEVTHADGNVSRGIWAKSPSAKLDVLFFQGNGEIVDIEGAMRVWQYQQVPANVFIFDRRGAGQTPGKATAANLKTDALELFDATRRKSSLPIVLHGFSLGTVVVPEVVKARPVAGVVLEGAIPTIEEFLAQSTPWYVAPFVRLKPTHELKSIDLARDLSDFTGPILIAVGEKDHTTPEVLSRSLYKKLDSKLVRLEVVEGAGHYALTQPNGFAVLKEFLGGIAR